MPRGNRPMSDRELSSIFGSWLESAAHNGHPGGPLVVGDNAREAILRLPYSEIFCREVPMANQRRVVRVLVVDPNENVPLGDCLLFRSEEKLTDLTDQELFFEIGIQNMLDAHNEKRKKIIDKNVKDRTEYLGAARIRDLKMLVVTLAQF